MIVSALALSALAVTSGMLLAARESLGESRAAITEAANINRNMETALEAAKNNLADYETQLEGERIAREKAQREKELAQIALAEAKAESRRRLRDAESTLEGQDLVCANAYVPQSFIDSLHDTILVD